MAAPRSIGLLFAVIASLALVISADDSFGWPLTCNDTFGSGVPSLFKPSPGNLSQCNSCEMALCSCLEPFEGSHSDSNHTVSVPESLQLCPNPDRFAGMNCEGPTAPAAIQLCLKSFYNCKEDLAAQLSNQSSGWCAQWAQELRLASLDNQANIFNLMEQNNGTIPNNSLPFESNLARSCLINSCSLLGFAAGDARTSSTCYSDRFDLSDICGYDGPLPTNEPTVAPTNQVYVEASLDRIWELAPKNPLLPVAQSITELYVPIAVSTLDRMLRALLQVSGGLPVGGVAVVLGALNKSRSNKDWQSIIDVTIQIQDVQEGPGVVQLIVGFSGQRSSVCESLMEGWMLSTLSQPAALQELGFLRLGRNDMNHKAPEVDPVFIAEYQREESTVGVPIWGFFVAVLGSCIVGLIGGFLVVKKLVGGSGSTSLRTRLLQEPINEGHNY